MNRLTKAFGTVMVIICILGLLIGLAPLFESILSIVVCLGLVIALTFAVAYIFELGRRLVS